MALQLHHIIADSLKRTKRAFIYVAVFSFFINLLLMTVPLYSLQVYDRVLSSHSAETLVMLTIITVGMFIALSMFTTVRSFILQQISEWMDSHTAPLLMRETISKAAYEQSTTTSQILRDFQSVKGFIAGPAVTSLMDAPWSVLFIIAIFFISPTLAVITIFGCVFLLIMAMITEAATKRLINKASRSTIKGFQSSEMATRNAEVIEAMGMMDNVIHNWQSQTEEGREYQHIASQRAAVISAITKTVRMTLQIMITCTGAWLAIHNEITMGSIIAAATLGSRALAPFESSISLWKQFVNGRESYHRITMFLRTTSAERGDTELPRPRGHLAFENVFFRPAGTDKLIVRGVNFQLMPGESLGIIGPSAAGKSTLARLIVGVWPATSGAIRLDGADVYKWSRRDFGKYVGYLPQGVELFPGTVKENIARLGEAPDSAVVEAAQLAGVHDMILRLPKGYDTMIGEKGGALSPGQKQRIGLARAFFGNPSLLVLDEPNSNLDGEGEQALIRAMALAKQRGITTVIVAHKPSLVGNVDKLLMLREGVQEAFGPRQEMLARYTQPAQQRPAAPPTPPSSGEQ